mmetsp:Transcript_15010/g.44477  ORF Transcript_15010/g.44477 Transcript_15010/m.44477 type:complete len:287 (+) Transcript_15010:378-1238(+)
MTSGVLDCKWSATPVEDGGRPLLACGLAEGSLALVQGCIGEEDTVAVLEQTEARGHLYLSVDWNDRRESRVDKKVVVSEASGEVAVWSLAQDRMELLQRWDAHQLCGCPSEVWIAAFNAFDDNVALSGADDACLKIWDLRQAGEGGAAVMIPRQHDAGVTTLCWCPTEEHLFVSGSYDEHIRLWDIRSPRQPITSCHVNGGVWRLKWHSTRPLLASASMHRGATVVSTAESSLKVLHEYQDHDSMAYGIDWCPGGTSTSIASCSFYDHALHFWEVPDAGGALAGGC